MQRRLIYCLWTVTLLIGASAARGQQADSQVLAVFSLDGPLLETPVLEDFPLGSAGGVPLKDLIARLKRARTDESVKGVVVLFGNASMGRGQLEELRRELDRVKAAGKKVHVHVDSLSMTSYALLSGASELSVVPTGDIWITGIYGESPYLRGLLDLIGVEPDFYTCGEYKSAAEMFMCREPSPAARENRKWLFDGIFESYLDLIAQGRGVDTDQVRKWVDVGLYSAESAKQAGIVDSVKFRHQFVADLKSEYGDTVKFDRRYGKKKAKQIDLSSPFGIIQFYADLLAGPAPRKSTKDAVAIVYVEGPIAPGKSDPGSFPFSTGQMAYSSEIRSGLDKAANDDSVKAVVLRVNSPGGSAVASEIILNATKEVKARKPLVVSMGDVAGSGGYYVACGADTIFADRTTITGSIGVVAGKLATREMWSKIGISWDPIQRGKNAGILGSGEVFSEDERERLQSWMDEVYGVFKNHVVAVRGERLKKDIDELAGGRVYTGQQALELGLVDKLGGLDDAIAYAAEQAKLEEYEVRVVPEPKSFLDLLLGDLAGDEQEEGMISLGVERSWSSRTALLDAALPLLKGLDQRRVGMALAALRQLELLKREHLTLTMPIIEIQP